MAHSPYLECQSSLHFLAQDLRDASVEVREDLHRELRFDTSGRDEIIEGIRERHADAIRVSQ